MSEQTRPMIEAEPLNMTMLMTPDMANFSGNVHGGAILKILDQVAYACAAHYSKHYVVTLSVDQVHFRQPIRVGELVTFKACVNYVGRSSMEVGVKVIAENIHTGEQRHTNSCYFTMVAKNEDGTSASVPALKLITEKDKARFVAAKLRKKLRIEHEKQLKAIQEKWDEHFTDLSEDEVKAAMSDEFQSIL